MKWFAPYDLSVPPRPIGEVITPAFIYMFLLSTASIYVFYWIDRFLYRKRFHRDTLSKMTISQETAYLIMKIATSAPTDQAHSRPIAESLMPTAFQ